LEGAAFNESRPHQIDSARRLKMNWQRQSLKIISNPVGFPRVCMYQNQLYQSAQTTRTNTDSSCSGLCRASTSQNASQIKEVHGRDNLGHAAAGRSRTTLFGIMYLHLGGAAFNKSRPHQIDSARRLKILTQCRKRDFNMQSLLEKTGGSHVIQIPEACCCPSDDMFHSSANGIERLRADECRRGQKASYYNT
jgi:hypothetical protein